MVHINPGLRAAGKGCAWLTIVTISLFVGLMIASAGTAVYPRTAALGAGLICAGEVEYDSYGASYRPGEYIVTREISCRTGDGKAATREDITLKAIGMTFLVYSGIAFALLAGLALLVRRRARGLLEAPPAGLAGAGPRPSAPEAAASGPPYSPADISAILEQVSDAIQRGGPAVSVRGMGDDASAGRWRDDGEDEAPPSPAERLARLQQLYDQRLITAEEYQAKRVEILSGL